MSELNSAIEFLETAGEVQTPPTDNLSNVICSEEPEYNFFDIQKFGQELYIKSETKNKERALRPNQNIILRYFQ